MDARYVNLGCGSRFHPDWINIDVVAASPGIIRHDLSKGIPLDDASCDAVYHSHLIEHLRREDVKPFLRECRRVLKPGGVMRIATPDLESICRTYLAKLEGASRGDIASHHDYEWIVLELLDQLVRERRGGQMRDFLANTPLPNDAFVHARIGDEALRPTQSRAVSGTITRPEKQRVASRLLRRLKRIPQRLSQTLLRSLAGPADIRALEVGRFRLGGEVHQWLYDRYSLARLLVSTGFVEPVVRAASTSALPDWCGFQLDTRQDGTVRKPDSLFMEAIVPPTTDAFSRAVGMDSENAMASARSMAERTG